MINIFIAGASGFIGKHLLDNLINYNKIYLYKRDLDKLGEEYQNKNNLICFEKQHNLIIFDYVINCIANTNTSNTNWKDLYESNCLTNLKLIEDLKYCYYIYLSTFSIYSEKSILLKYPDPNNLYGLSKYISEKIIQQKSSPKSISIILRLPIVIGKQKRQSDIVNFFYNKLIKDEEIEIFEGGKLLRNLIHYTEIVKVISAIIKYKPFADKYIIHHINSSNTMSVEKICDYIKSKIGSSSKIIITNKKTKNDFNSLIIDNLISLKNYKEQSVIDNIDEYLKEYM